MNGMKKGVMQNYMAFDGDGLKKQWVWINDKIKKER